MRISYGGKSKPIGITPTATVAEETRGITPTATLAEEVRGVTPTARNPRYYADCTKPVVLRRLLPDHRNNPRSLL